MTIMLNEEETKAYLEGMDKAKELGISFGQFLTKALEYKTKIKGQAGIIADQKAAIKVANSTIKDLESKLSAKPTLPNKVEDATTVTSIPELYANQSKVQKETDNRPKKSKDNGALDVIMGSKPTKVTVHTSADQPSKKKEKAKIKLKCALSKADKELLDELAQGKVRSNSNVNTFAAKRSLRPKTVLTYINKHSKGKYVAILGKDVPEEQIWPGASVYPNEFYFTAKA